MAVTGLYKHAITHLSGLVTSAAVNLVNNKVSTALVLIGDVFAWAAGTFLSAILTGNNKYHLGRHYGLGFAINSAVLFGSSIFLIYYHAGDDMNALYQRGIPDFSEWAVAFACGVQNGLTSNYSGNLFRTTHATGMWNDTAMLVGHYLRWGETKDLWRIKIFFPLFVSFFIGGLLGTVAWNVMQRWALFIPASYSALFAIAIFVLRQIPERDYEKIDDDSDYSLESVSYAGTPPSYGSTTPTHDHRR